MKHIVFGFIFLFSLITFAELPTLHPALNNGIEMKLKEELKKIIDASINIEDFNVSFSEDDQSPKSSEDPCQSLPIKISSKKSIVTDIQTTATFCTTKDGNEWTNFKIDDKNQDLNALMKEP